MQNYLKTAEKLFSKQDFYTEFKDPNLLVISDSPDTAPFAFICIEKEQFEGLVLCLSVDFTDAFMSADMVISLFHIAPVAMGDCFYYSKTGIIYWNQDAATQYQLECDPELFEKMIPVSQESH